jgi:hypothetical protein
MKKTKFNPELLKEELNRFKMINEYSFGGVYEKDLNSDNPTDDLLIGNNPISEVDEDPNDTASNVAADLGIPDDGGNDGPQPPAAPDTEGPEDIPNPANAEEPAAPEAPAPAPAPEMPAEPAADEEEIDVTSLVNSTDEAKEAADKASQNTLMLMQKLEDLEARIASMDAVSGKIEDLEKEIIKRNPTNVEKLEMQSLHSGPYTQKLTDYWADKHGQYDVMGNDDKKQEYVLTKDDVDADYSDNEVKKSFSVRPEEFEEEDI